MASNAVISSEKVPLILSTGKLLANTHLQCVLSGRFFSMHSQEYQCACILMQACQYTFTIVPHVTCITYTVAPVGPGVGLPGHCPGISSLDAVLTQPKRTNLLQLQHVVHFSTLKTGRSLGTRLPNCLLYTSPSPRDATLSRMPSSA